LADPIEHRVAIKEALADVPDRTLASILTRGLSFDLAQRHRDLTELGEDLRRWL
jgi:hypothetical protein